MAGKSKRNALVFDGAGVAEQIEHAKNAPNHKAAYGGDAKAALWFVKDSGAYLMSNGQPPLHDATEHANSPMGNAPAKVVYAKGYGPEDDYQALREACGGDDFVEILPLETFTEQMVADFKAGRANVEITMTAKDIRIEVVTLVAVRKP